MLGDQSWSKLGKLLPQLRYDLGPDKVLYGLFGCFIRINVYVELWADIVSMKKCANEGLLNEGNIRRTHLPLYRGLPPEL